MKLKHLLSERNVLDKARKDRLDFTIPLEKEDRIQDILSSREYSMFVDYYYNRLSRSEMMKKYGINISSKMGFIRDKIKNWESDDIMDRNVKSDMSNDEFTRHMSDNSYEDYGVYDNMKRSVTGVLSTLTPREEKALRLEFGINDNGKELTYDELAKKLGVSKTRAEQIIYKALRKLKHPTRSRKLRSYLEN